MGISGRLRRLYATRIIIDHNRRYERSILVAGTVRSGTTWLAALINYNNEYRYLFEPLYPDLPHSHVLGPRMYVRPGNRDPELLEQAQAILSGAIRHPRVDQFNQRAIAGRRLIKVIHGNLMLKWIRSCFPHLPIVLLLRHPCAIVQSLLKLGWPTALEHILDQDGLLSTVLQPFRQAIEHAQTPFERHLLLWCVETYVPLKELAPNDVHLVFYEELCQHPGRELAALYEFLGREFDERVLARLKEPSPLTRPDSAIFSGGSAVESWKEDITGGQLKAALEMLHLFGLDRIYSEGPMPNVQAGHKLLAEGT